MAAATSASRARSGCDSAIEGALGAPTIEPVGVDTAGAKGLALEDRRAGSPCWSHRLRRRARDRAGRTRDARSASARSSPNEITFAISESKSDEITDSVVTPESTRVCGPSAGSKSAMRPGEGRKPSSGSSAQTRASRARPRRSTGISAIDSPRAMRIWVSTRSTPAISSVMPCSTCSRGFTSRKKKSSPVSRNSTVPTPQ